MTSPRQDTQTVNPDGTPVTPLIHGVVITPAITHAEERGTLCEILNKRVHDVYRLPLGNDTIPYKFVKLPGW